MPRMTYEDEDESSKGNDGNLHYNLGAVTVRGPAVDEKTDNTTSRRSVGESTLPLGRNDIAVGRVGLGHTETLQEERRTVVRSDNNNIVSCGSASDRPRVEAASHPIAAVWRKGVQTMQCIVLRLLQSRA